MAIVTNQVASFSNGLVRAEIDLDDISFKVKAARVINDSDYPTFIEVFKAGLSVGSATVPAHFTQSKKLPASVRFSMDNGDPEHGIPPEMTMGDIMIRMRYPS